jgi:tryptophan synthase alpha chain
MNRIDETFDRLKQKNESALVGFVTAGDPKPDVSLQILDAMCRAGVDVLELGVPFSDPTADGPVIQRSSARALESRMSLQRAFEMTCQLRARYSLPIVLFSYYNPILQYGTAAFYRSATEAGADGVLVVDLPPEESAEFTDHWADNDLHLIRLIAPTTPPERMRRIAASGSGFLYLVSKTGVTGSDGLNTVDITQKMPPLPTGWSSAVLSNAPSKTTSTVRTWRIGLPHRSVNTRRQPTGRIIIKGMPDRKGSFPSFAAGLSTEASISTNLFTGDEGVKNVNRHG